MTSVGLVGFVGLIPPPTCENPETEPIGSGRKRTHETHETNGGTK